MKPWEEHYDADGNRVDLVSHRREDAQSSGEAKRGVVSGVVAVISEWESDPSGQAVARAKLLAAAPELYRALEELLSVLMRDGVARGLSAAIPSFDSAFGSGIAALRKARGEP